MMYQSLEIQNVTDELYEEVNECTTCPVCFQKFQSPIMGCSNGHAVCNSCIRMGNIKKCPTCKAKKIDCRQLGLEKIAKSLHWPCSNKDEGCPEMLKFETISNHEIICRYQKKMCCPMSDCNSNIMMLPKDIENHLIDVHNIQVEKIDTACKDTIVDMDFEICSLKKWKGQKNTTLETHKLIKLESVLFFLTVIENISTLKFRSTMIGSPQNNDEYFIEKQFCAEQNEQKFSIMEPMTDIVGRAELKRKASEFKCSDLNYDVFIMDKLRMNSFKKQQQSKNSVQHFVQMRVKFPKKIKI